MDGLTALLCLLFANNSVSLPLWFMPFVPAKVNVPLRMPSSGAVLEKISTLTGKHVNNVQVVNFDKEFFKGKKVLVFDDVITRGYSYARFACHLETLGASVLGGMFLARTLFV